jgi:ADP-ribosyl-[dinitrogen reductase] hydrolase
VSGQEGTAADRAAGALLGLAVGDAVGTTLEFAAPGSFEPIDDMVGGGPFGLRPGEWTDDNSMALCLAESVLDRDGMDLSDQLSRYLLWFEHGYLSSNGRCFDIGFTTSSQLRRFTSSGEPVDPRPDQDAAANGSLMRLAGVPIRWHRDPAEAADMSGACSRSTHAAERPVDACRVLGAMLASLIAGTPAKEVLDPDFWRWGRLHPEVEAVARGSWRTKEPPAVRGTGYCVDALEAALWAVGGASSYRQAVLRAANLGDDADTTAAIAGQLAGARWGASGIPPSWRTMTAMNDRIASLASNLFRAGGGPPNHRWELDDLVHAWWVEPERVLAGEYPGHSDRRRAEEKVAVLLDAGIRTFVDLTTGDDGLVPYDRLVAEAAERRGLPLAHHSAPIPDLGTVDDTAYDELVDLVTARQRHGGVYVHCWGGVGRTGTVVGCLLAASGLAHDEVLAQLGELRSGTSKAVRACPETPGQLDVLRRRSGGGSK